MIRNLYVSTVVLILLMIAGDIQAQRRITPVKGGIQEARNMAMKEGKLIMAVFYTDWCLPCKWMDDNTFVSPEVVDFAEKHYKVVRLNIDDLEGYNARQQYNVEFLPTIILLDQGAGVLAKFEESLSAKRLMEAMEKHRFDLESKSIRLSSTPPPAVKLSDMDKKEPPTKESVSAPKEMPKQESKPVVTESQPKPTAPVKEEPKHPIAEATPQNTAPRATQQENNTAPQTPQNTSKETFVLEDSKTKPSTNPAATGKTTPKPVTQTAPSGNYYSVQVGTFSRFENADKMRNEYREIFGEGVHIKIEQSGADTIYKVMIGRYNTYETAEPLLALLKEQGMEGFIKTVKQD
jgi:cell division protein FtsN